MRTDDFDYPLPEDLIANYPPERRGDSRLLVYNRGDDSISHCHFADLPRFLCRDDLLVFNDTRVIPARLLGHKETGGKVEILLIREIEAGLWEAMIKSSKGIKKGLKIHIDNEIDAEVDSVHDGKAYVRMRSDGDLKAAIDRCGRMPLPPYIKREVNPEDRERYQTIYAAKEGAVAAPTAGLHFTDEIMDELRSRGVEQAMVTLHVGPGTFQPVRVENIDAHTMHREYFEIDNMTAEKIEDARGKGARIVAVGTTVVRTLESAFSGGKVLPNRGWTDIFVHPGYRFKVVDSLITNFHLPRSTLFMLVAAMAGTDCLKEIYAEAVRERYRFFSYGDAMLII